MSFLSTRRTVLSTVVFASLVALASAAPPSTDGGGLPANPPEKGDDRIYDGFPRLAGFAGWLSIGAWLVVYSPQLYLCVQEQSGEGLSLVFLLIVILIFQVFYYRRKRALYPDLFPSDTTSERSALLPSSSSSASIKETTQTESQMSRNVLSVLAVVAWVLFSWNMGSRAPRGRKLEVWDDKAQFVGWCSAFLYLGSRLPQIAKNMETKCEGLSLLMFAFAAIGNITYVSSIFLQSVSPQHLLINLSWLVGSGGTIFLDFIVLCQFWYYAKARKEGKVFLTDSDGLVEDEV
ncbi:Cystinosin/ERS1p repeat protein [Pseudohyphozyma bogoriensis]|nr:Cystinosin/ERS1p repeat protein [Pseudohyphozyma bogoriensis]